jgi:TPR repeat protein
MSSDEYRTSRRRPRPIPRPQLAPGPLKDLKDLVHDWYLWADAPTMDEIAAEVAGLAAGLGELIRGAGQDQDDAEAEVDALIGAAPKRDTISRIISSDQVPPGQQDVVAVVVALARLAGRLSGQGTKQNLVALVEQVRELWRRAHSTPPPLRLGKPISQCTPSELEVHRAIDVADHGERPLLLPLYAPRAHDARLLEVIDAVNGGISTIAILVGGPSTGKTRACWEAVQALTERWWLWHPVDPSRPHAAARDLERVGPFTVVWLNEIQHYLLTANPALGERIAAGFRTLLTDPGRSPVLVLGTIWREDWDVLTSAPIPRRPDPHAQARALLTGTDIAVPDSFTGLDLDALRDTAGGDARLRHAVEHATAGRITQHLAGVPELLQRYRNAPPMARAIIHTAMDACRLGHPLPIPHALLAQAAPGYLTDHEWEESGEDWLEQALAYTAKPCRGTPGPVTRLRPRPGDHAAPTQPYYRLAAYLEQTSRADRAGVFPPASFWNTVAAVVADPAVLLAIGSQAERRGRYNRAAQLYRRAVDGGDTIALITLAALRARAGDLAGADALYRHAAAHGDINGLITPVTIKGHTTARATLVGLGTPDAMALNSQIVEALHGRTADLGDGELILMVPLVVRDERAPGDGTVWAPVPLASLRDADTRTLAETLALQAAHLGDSDWLVRLALDRDLAGDQATAQVLALQAANHGDVYALYRLAARREILGDQAGAEDLYRQAANHGEIDAPSQLALRKEILGDQAGAEDLYRQAANHGDTAALFRLALLMEDAGDPAGAERLRRFGLDDDGGLAEGSFDPLTRGDQSHS